MIVVILAAGMGTRLMPLTKTIPKTLLKIDNNTILEKIVINCVNNQITDFLVVVGHGKDEVIEECSYLEEKYKINFKIIENPEYDKTNTGYSLFRATSQLKKRDYIVINGDNVFDEKIIENLLNTKSSAMIIDDFKKLDHESFKIRIKDSIIVDMGKEIDINTSNGEFIGISKILSRDSNLFKEILSKITKDNPQEYYDIAYLELSKESKIEFVSTEGLKWTEVDDMKDFKYAKSFPRN